MADKAPHGAADDYYQGEPQPTDQSQPESYGAPPPQQRYAQPTYQPPQTKYEPGQDFQFNQAFKVEKPKWNDIWAGILFLITCAGFVAVSGIALQGYASTRGTNGSGIYDGTNDFGLSTNT
jgi:hypothetical protein